MLNNKKMKIYKKVSAIVFSLLIIGTLGNIESVFGAGKNTISSHQLQNNSKLKGKKLTTNRDVTAPSNIAEFTVAAFHTANNPAVVDISWQSATDNFGVIEYILERSNSADFTNSKVYNFGTVTNFRDKSVIPNTTYYWRIKAKDAAGNISADWISAMKATLIAPVVNKQFTIEGDSASVGYGLSKYEEGPPEVYSSQRWGAKLGEMLDGTWVVRTVAKGGDGILSDIPTDRADEITAFRQPKYERDVVLLWAGTNDIYGLPSRGIANAQPLIVYNAMKKYLQLVKSDGFEVWVMDAYKRSAFGFADKDVERNVFNNLIRADSSFADKFIDIDAWAEFQSRSNRTVYQSDQTHLTTDGNKLVASRIYDELFKNPLVFTTNSALPDGKISTPYSQIIVASGGNGMRIISLVKGKLPLGIKLLNGKISGSPTQKGKFSFTLKVKDELGTTVNRLFNLTIL